MLAKQSADYDYSANSDDPCQKYMFDPELVDTDQTVSVTTETCSDGTSKVDGVMQIPTEILAFTAYNKDEGVVCTTTTADEVVKKMKLPIYCNQCFQNKMDRIFFGQKFLNGSILCATLDQANFVQSSSSQSSLSDSIEYVKMPKFYNISEESDYAYAPFLRSKAVPLPIREGTISSVLILQIEDLSEIQSYVNDHSRGVFSAK